MCIRLRGLYCLYTFKLMNKQKYTCKYEIYGTSKSQMQRRPNIYRFSLTHWQRHSSALLEFSVLYSLPSEHQVCYAIDRFSEKERERDRVTYSIIVCRMALQLSQLPMPPPPQWLLCRRDGDYKSTTNKSFAVYMRVLMRTADLRSDETRRSRSTHRSG